ncbi:MAG: tRNA (adenosine(37)-N6)-threonylcarbamoyltransferase complex ATPase subunit type 1 TsaE [Nautilia sp.]|nr:MAG: tRNA (adenosine(37)-N6)-threonylcarbamoyltransferase complex ATPase subunit type 1 TsaE [Nautilia sp.]
MNRIEVKNIEDLKKVIECVKNSDKNIIILSGTLGSGKTTFVKEFVKSMKINDEVTSPTFSIQNVYEDKVFHYDLYNKTIEDFLRLGMLEELEKQGYHFIEWGEELEKILQQFGFEYLKIEIELFENKRIFNCIN